MSECYHNEEVPSGHTIRVFWSEERVYSQDKMDLNHTKEKEKQKSQQDFLEGCRQAALQNENKEKRCPSKVKRNVNIDQRHNRGEKKREVKDKYFIFCISLLAHLEILLRRERARRRAKRI